MSVSALTRRSSLWVDQVFPPSVVATTTVLPDWRNPIARQSDVLAQEMPSRYAMERGRVWVVQVLPPSVVATTTPLPNCVPPTAQQSEALGQEMPSRVAAVPRVWVVQVLPLSVVAKTSEAPATGTNDEYSPIAQQSEALAQEMPSRDVDVLLGRVSAVQVFPPSVVATTEPLAGTVGI
jgi:hypothetical protein